MSSGVKLVRFGVFEVDLKSGELRKSGMKIRLADQPFRILALLLEHPGEVVSRDELRRQLWSSQTFVDFEHSLNAAVKRLREALCDSADNPQFIETLPRHGYRFIAFLENESSEIAVKTEIANVETFAAAPRKGFFQRNYFTTRTIAVVLLAGTAALAIHFLLRRRQNAPFAEFTALQSPIRAARFEPPSHRTASLS